MRRALGGVTSPEGREKWGEVHKARDCGHLVHSCVLMPRE